jgi:hypothetical protein
VNLGKYRRNSSIVQTIAIAKSLVVMDVALAPPQLTKIMKVNIISSKRDSIPAGEYNARFAGQQKVMQYVTKTVSVI